VTSPISGRQLTRRRLRLASGLTLFAYVASHFANHAAGLLSLDAAEAVRLWFTAFWRSAPATALFYGAFVVHLSLAFVALYERRTLRMPAAELLRLVLGFAIPFLLASHFTGTRLAWELYGQDDPYARIAWANWMKDRGLSQLALMTLAWTHGCLGIHFAWRHRAAYRGGSHALFAVAVLAPTLAFLGFLAMAAEIQARGPASAAVFSALSPDETEALSRIADGLMTLVAALLAAVLAARALRAWTERRSGTTIALRYPGRVVHVPRGWSVLEASRANGIPHLSLCGGRARCSTCRVQVEGAAAHLPPANADEQRTLERIRAAPNLRLACQLRPTGELGVTPLLKPHPEKPSEFGIEREVVILFIDLRRWTGLAEQHLPHDLVYVLEHYFDAVGDAVRAAGGVPNQFIGDSVMAIFGLETDFPSACRQALDAARGIAGRMAGLNEKLQREFGHSFGFGIGIHAGPAAVGEVGYRNTRTLSAVGDAVNTASRLQALTKEYGVPLIVSERVALSAGLDVSQLQPHQLALRGRAAPLAVFAVRSIADIAP
jgi:adenylate cyclase